jgi:hypothetical protein
MNLVFSSVHDWENDPAVKQVLVFSCNKAVDHFNEKYKKREIETIPALRLSIDSDCGAIFKLRAVKLSDDKYMPLLRCGVTGYLLSQNHTEFDDFEEAIEAAKELLINYLK